MINIAFFFGHMLAFLFDERKGSQLDFAQVYSTVHATLSQRPPGNGSSSLKDECPNVAQLGWTHNNFFQGPPLKSEVNLGK